MIRYLVFTVSFLFLACQSEDKSSLNAEVPDSTLVAILSEAHMADAAIYSGTFRVNHYSDNRKRIISDILTRYDVTDSAFFRSIRQLNTHPAQFKSVYEKVITRLSENSP
ncbi:MAG: hypothetical protein RLZZ46_1074 [Bacteroidota bacterium]|jgi:hypothetical protein